MSQRSLIQILFNGDDLLLLERAVISIFRIRPLENYSPESRTYLDAKPTPLLRLAVPTGVNSFQSSWNTGTPSPLHPCYIGVICKDDNDRVTIYRYILKHVDNKPSDGLPRCIPLDRYIQQPISQCRRGFSTQDHPNVRMWKDNLAVIWGQPDNLFGEKYR
jgi:hypothetical protein